MDSQEDKRWRLMEAAMALLQEAPGQQLNIVLLNKALFYLDLCALRDLGDTITHNTYLALDQGPVIARYQDRLVGALQTANLARQEQDGRAKPLKVVNEIEAFEFLGPQERALAQRVAQKVGALTSSRASELTHKNPGWKLAYAAGRELGKPPLPIDMLIALQELGESDPWMSEPPDEAFENAVLAAERDPGSPW